MIKNTCSNAGSLLNSWVKWGAHNCAQEASNKVQHY